MEHVRGRMRPWQGILVLAASGVLLFFVSPMILKGTGAAGLFFGELLLVVPVFLAVPLFRWKVRDVLPFQRIHAGAVVGTILFWIGGSRIVSALTYAVLMLFPQLYSQDSISQGAALSEIPWFILIFVLAFTPAVVEEILFRGVFAGSLRPIGNKWAVVCVTGIVFGAFHGDVLKFFPTAVLGIMLGYLMVETGNLFYGMVFHFVNNLVSAIGILSFGWIYKYMDSYAAGTEEIAVNSFGLGTSLISCTVAPVCIYVGNYLLHSHSFGHQKALLPKGRQDIVISLVAGSAGILVTGIYLTVLGLL